MNYLIGRFYHYNKYNFFNDKTDYDILSLTYLGDAAEMKDIYPKIIKILLMNAEKVKSVDIDFTWRFFNLSWDFSYKNYYEEIHNCFQRRKNFTFSIKKRMRMKADLLSYCNSNKLDERRQSWFKEMINNNYSNQFISNKLLKSGDYNCLIDYYLCDRNNKKKVELREKGLLNSNVAAIYLRIYKIKSVRSYGWRKSRKYLIDKCRFIGNNCVHNFHDLMNILMKIIKIYDLY
jgi:hypothetical protein